MTPTKIAISLRQICIKISVDWCHFGAFYIRKQSVSLCGTLQNDVNPQLSYTNLTSQAEYPLHIFDVDSDSFLKFLLRFQQVRNLSPNLLEIRIGQIHPLGLNTQNHKGKFFRFLFCVSHAWGDFLSIRKIFLI